MRTKTEAVSTLRADQQFWRELAARVGPGRYADPGPMGEWSFGDMAGHVDADFTDHLHDEHVPAVEAWLSQS